MAVLGVWLWLPRRAGAQDVVLDMSACSEPDPAAVRALLGVELRERLLQADRPPPSDAQVVEVRCGADVAELWLRGTQARKSVALSSVPIDLRARVLALSIAELAARPQPSAAVTLAPEPPAPPPPAPEPPVAPEPPPDFALWLAVETQATPLFSLGGSLLLRARIYNVLAWSTALSFAQASTGIDRGRLRVLHASLRTGPALWFESGRATLQVGAGVRAGWLRLSGEPADDASTASGHFSAWYIGPALFAGASLRLASQLFVALELEVAHALREVRADVEGGSARTLSPWRSSAALGLGVAW